MVRYLLGRKRLPQTVPDYTGLGDDNEAIVYMAEFGEAWLDTSGGPQVKQP